MFSVAFQSRRTFGKDSRINEEDASFLPYTELMQFAKVRLSFILKRKIGRLVGMLILFEEIYKRGSM